MSIKKVRTIKKIKKIDIVISISILILVLTFILLKIFISKSNTYLSSYAVNQTKNIAENLIIKTVHNNNNLNYKEIIITNKKEDGEIIDIDLNNQLINDYLYNISNYVLDTLSNLEKGNLEKTNLKYYNIEDNFYLIPSGLIYNIPYITNIFPKIPFKVTPIGNVNSNINTKITDYGINNSLLELKINIAVELKILYPFLSKTIKIEKEIPIITKLIKGKIPSYYGGIISNN